jgi:hypothetical protein
MAGPFVIETTYPASTDIQSQYPAKENAFRQTVSDWLSTFSDPADGSLKTAAFAGFLAAANTWTGPQTFGNISTTGTATIAGTTTVHEFIIGDDATLVMGLATAGTLYFRPASYASGTGQMTLASNGDVSIAGSLTLGTALAVAEGGTGATTAASARTNLGLGTLATKNDASLTADVTGTLPVANGGTAATTAAAARTNLGLGSAATTSSSAYATAAQGAKADAALPAGGGTITGSLTVNGNMSVNQNLFSITANMVIGPNGAGAVYLRPNGPGSATGQFFVNSAGDASCAGTLSAVQVTYTSDARMKSSITPISSAVAKVQRLSGYLYHRDDINEDSAGLIAQEVQDVLPEAVRADEDGKLSLDPGPVLGLLVQAVKELSYGASL